MNPNNRPSNGNGNGNGNGSVSPLDELTRHNAAQKPVSVKDALKKETFSPFSNSDQAVILKQSPFWSRGVVWTIIGVTTAAIAWAALANIEQVVLAKGQLKPKGTVKDIQAPFNGVVSSVKVKDGQQVKAGQVLLTLDSTATVADLRSQQKIKQSLTQEAQFYRTLMQQSLTPAQVETEIARLKLPWEVAALARNRAALVAENDLYRVQLKKTGTPNTLTPEQQSRLQAFQSELSSRASAARLEAQQLQKQRNQTLVQLADAQKQIQTDRQVLSQLRARNQETLDQSQQGLTVDKKILSALEPLLEEGGVAKLQVERQRQAIMDRAKQLAEQEGNGLVEFDKQNQQIQQRLADIQRFEQENLRLTLAIDQAQSKLNNTLALTEKEVRDKLSDNGKRIAEIDSQLIKILIENEKRIAELEGQIGRSQVNLKYQSITSPVNGTVFDLKAFPGYVPPPTQTEALLKIVPDDYLIAEVDVTNADIGFVSKGQKADVRVDSFPFSEFGDVKGTVDSIGSDALPPDQIHREYRFPIKIKLNQQFMRIKGRDIALQSGMSVSANIKVNENRTVLSIFTDLFWNTKGSLERMR
jgi:HlyD family secretion protein